MATESIRCVIVTKKTEHAFEVMEKKPGDFYTVMEASAPWDFTEEETEVMFLKRECKK